MMVIKTIWELCLFQAAPQVSRWGFQMAIFVFLTETGAERVAMATILMVSFCSFYDAHLWCQVSRTLL